MAVEIGYSLILGASRTETFKAKIASRRGDPHSLSLPPLLTFPSLSPALFSGIVLVYTTLPLLAVG